MTQRCRREFLADVGRGMLVAGLGSALATDLGVTPAWADADDRALDFGPREPLVCLMQETPPEKLLATLVQRLRHGDTLADLVAAAALANARTFGGQDYIGFHTLMALTPALHMARELPRDRAALPVFKVLYRNTSRIQAEGGRSAEVLHDLELQEHVPDTADGRRLLEAVKRKDMQAAEQIFAHIAQGSPEDAFNELLIAVQDEQEVHRVVLPYRAWSLLDLVGREHAHTLLRQSVRYCVENERPANASRPSGARTILPDLLDEYKLLEHPRGTRKMDDTWIDEMCRTIYGSSPEQSAEAVAAALAEGIAPLEIGEAIALAANQLVLRDEGRPPQYASAAKPEGSVHGDSVGVHACDAVNAWINMSQIANRRNQAACLILGAYQVARDRARYLADRLDDGPYPWAEHLEEVRATTPAQLLAEAETGIRANDQGRACAAVSRYLTAGGSEDEAFALLLRYATSEDGALHAEKFYRTVREEHARTRRAFRGRQLAALAKVTASTYGHPAPGLAEAERLLPQLASGS